ncbi:MAG TPA: hypothetical protein VF394_02570 [Candidatus Acidoferrum sp.]
MNSLRFHMRGILLGGFAAGLMILGATVPDSTNARGQQSLSGKLEIPDQAPPIELIIAGPETVPLPRRDWRPRFTAVLINRSNDLVVFVPPRKDWYGERRLEWQAVDSKGRWLDRQPNYAIECDVHGVMRMVPDLPASLLATRAPRQIRDADLVVLQPGERYELKNLADPWFSLNFRRHGIYTLNLNFAFASGHYELPKNSQYASALKNSSLIEASSNELRLTIN